MKIILSHSGKQHSYYVAQAMHRQHALQNFYTSSYIGNPLLQKIISRFDLHYLSRRFIKGLDSSKVHSAWKYELKEIFLRLTRADSRKVNEAVYFRDEAFDLSMAKKLMHLSYDVFWGFQGSCLQSLKSANERSKTSVLEMTIAHLPFAEKILNEEKQLLPEWADSIDFSNFPSAYATRLIQEPLEARRVVAISAFLKHTLTQSGVDAAKIDVLPLGFDSQQIPFSPETTSIENRPLRVLYAGRVTQRKGIYYALEAIRKFRKQDVELHIIGNVHGRGEAFKKYSDLYQYSPGISQMELFKKYSEYDLLLFPSILEGFGLVTVEAMGAGLPVITTPNTNATELLQDGRNGFLVPIRDVDAIVQAITKVRSLSNDQFQTMRHAARTAAMEYTWTAYAERLKEYLLRLETKIR